MELPTTSLRYLRVKKFNAYKLDEVAKSGTKKRKHQADWSMAVQYSGENSLPKRNSPCVGNRSPKEANAFKLLYNFGYYPKRLLHCFYRPIFCCYLFCFPFFIHFLSLGFEEVYFDMLQLAALGLILYCSHFVELSVVIVLVLLGVYNFPRVWVSQIKTQW